MSNDLKFKMKMSSEKNVNVNEKSDIIQCYMEICQVF